MGWKLIGMHLFITITLAGLNTGFRVALGTVLLLRAGINGLFWVKKFQKLSEKPGYKLSEKPGSTMLDKSGRFD